MEPTLKDISDYKKPLGASKTSYIVGAFAILIMFYYGYAIFLEGLFK